MAVDSRKPAFNVIPTSNNSVAGIRVEAFMCFAVLLLYIVGGNALTISLLPGERFPIKIAEIAAAVFCLIYIPIHGIKFHEHEWAVSAWLAFGVLSAAIGLATGRFSFGQFAYGMAYPLRILLLLLTANLAVTIGKRNNFDLALIMQGLYVIVCLIGLAQLAMFPVAFDWYRVLGVNLEGLDPHIGRLLSTYLDPNFLSACLLLPLSVALFRWRETNEIIQLMLAAFFAVCILLTVSRSGLLGLAIVALVFCVTETDKKSFIRNLCIMAVCVMALMILAAANARLITRVLTTAADASAGARINSWALGIEFALQNPIIGSGYNMVGALKAEALGNDVLSTNGFGLDSSLLVILVTTGSVGSILALTVCARGIVSIARRKSVCSWGSWSFLAVLFAVLVICNFNNVLFYVLWAFPVLVFRGELEAMLGGESRKRRRVLMLER